MSPAIGWTEVRALVPLGWQELVAETLTLGPCTTAAFGRPNLGVPEAPEGFDYVRTFIPDHVDDEELRQRMREAVAVLVERVGLEELAGIRLEFKRMPPEDYAESWKKSWKPFRVAPLCFLPPWDERELLPGELRFAIEPGGSFGSGRHATTRTCLRVLTRRITGGERVLDAGCGSGILSVAATLLGAERVFGFDIDPNSEVAARGLAVDNGVTERCRFQTAGFECLEGVSGDFDVVLANIYSDIIAEHAALLRSRIAPEGWFAFSGSPAHHAESTRSAILAAGLALDEVLVRGRWHTFVGRRARGAAPPSLGTSGPRISPGDHTAGR